jgi:hypothetical protein
LQPVPGAHLDDFDFSHKSPLALKFRAI